MTEIICILLLILLAMAYVIWSMDRLLDKEKEDYDDLMAIHQRTLKDLERKDRLLAAWEKGVIDNSYLSNLQTLSEEERQIHLMGKWNIPRHPCEGCTTGWGSANSQEVHTCEETCEKLAAWAKKQKAEG